jgi:hypothetical protein
LSANAWRRQSGTARKDLEKKTGKRVVSPDNYLNEPGVRKMLVKK